MEFELNGGNLTIDKLAELSSVERGIYPTLSLAPAARQELAGVRTFMDSRWLTADAPLIYSLNTGTGAFKDRRLSSDEVPAAQRKGILAFCAGFGDPFSERETRAMMIARSNSMAQASSGARPELIDRLLSFLNHGLHPIVPQKGSVGTSGDLAPLAHMSAALIGVREAEIVSGGQRLPAREAIAAAGLPVDIELFAKDTSSLMNGATTSAAVLALNAFDARRLLKAADISLALSLEAMRGEIAAFDPRLHAARPHGGQIAVARNISRIVSGSRRCSEAARQIVFPNETRQAGVKAPPRVQDVYSLRCSPQVHGPARQALEYVCAILETELNSATGNPLVLSDSEEGYVAIAGGHFHGQYIAQAADFLTIALADLGSISERRLVRLIDPNMSYGLPRNLATGRPGLDTGYPAVQTAMSALVMENRGLSTPGSVDSIPGKGNFEDHVSNATWCARKSTAVLRNVEQIIAIEALMAAQALTLVEPLTAEFALGRGTAAAVAAIREEIDPCLEGDRFFATEMEKAVSLIRSGRLLKAVEDEIGALD